MALLLPALLQACASPGQSVMQSIRIETPGCAEVACELTNDRGRWLLPRSPGSVTLASSNTPLEVHCSASSGTSMRSDATASLAPTTGAGAVAGGMVGGAAVGAAAGATALAFIPPLGVIAVLSGVAVGAVTGQAVESSQRAMRYPELISVPMHCAAAAPTRPAGAALGLGIRGLLPAAAREAGIGERGAVLVTSVSPGGAADAAGLREGDIVLALDGHALADAADLQERVSAAPPGSVLGFRIWRHGQGMTLNLVRSALAP